MEFGLVLPTEHLSDRTAADAWSTVQRRARYAEDAEFESLWVGEHHFMDHTYFDNFQTLSYLAGVTEEITLGTSVCLGPLHNPIQLAERIANLDVQNGGRTILGLGLGYRREEFEVLGIDRSRRVPRLLDTLDLLDRCWREDEVSYRGEVFSFEAVSVNPKPLRNPPIWLGGKAPASLRRAARRGDAWLPAPIYSFDELEECYPIYDETTEGEPKTRPLWRELFVTPDDERAIERAKRSLVAKYDSYARDHDGDEEGATGSVEERFERYRDGRFLFGTPDEVISEITTYQERFGIDHLLVRTQWPGLADDDAETSLEMLVDEVIPALS